LEHFDVNTGIFIGVCATFVMDLWLVSANKLFGFDKPNWHPVGRWVVECLQGRVVHEDISLVRSYAYENQIGWSFHYLVGAIYGIFFLYLISGNWIDLPLLVNALLFGWVTISAGWFFLHPCLGLGVALNKTENPQFGRLTGLIAHTAFGLGLWLPFLV